MIYYFLISIISVIIGAVLGVVYSSTKREEAEIEHILRKHDYLTKDLSCTKEDADIAYLRYLYGIDSHRDNVN